MNDRHPVKAAIVGIIFVVIFVVLVWLGVNILLSMEPEMEFLFNDTIFYAALFGVPMAALAAMSAYFEPGELYRLVFSISGVPVSILYFIFLFGSLDLGWHGDEFIYSISMSGILMLIVIFLILKGGYNVTEYVLCRNNEDLDEQEDEMLLNRAEGLKQEGWLVDDLIETIKADTEQGHEALEWYERRIDALRPIKNRYGSLEAHRFQLKTWKLEKDLMDPRNDPKELEKRVDKLADHVRKEMNKS